MPGCSIIICCHNSSKKLPHTLMGIATQNVSNLVCELILVDNNSTDDTAAIASEIWRQLGHPFPLMIANENRPGLIYARKAGINLASNEIILFCDDDNWLPQDYASKGCKFLN